MTALSHMNQETEIQTDVINDFGDEYAQLVKRVISAQILDEPIRNGIILSFAVNTLQYLKDQEPEFLNIVKKTVIHFLQ